MIFAALDRLPHIRAWACRPLDAASFQAPRERARTLRWLASILSDEAIRLDALDDAHELASQRRSLACRGGQG